MARASNGSIDTVASDHAPWTRELKLDPKLDITRGRPGVAELDTMLPLLYTEGVDDRAAVAGTVRRADLDQRRQAVRHVPAQGDDRASAPTPTSSIWETRERRVVRDADLFSRAGHSVYAGRELRGWPQTTLRRGELVFDERQDPGPARQRPSPSAAADRSTAAPELRPPRRRNGSARKRRRRANAV